MSTVDPDKGRPEASTDTGTDTGTGQPAATSAATTSAGGRIGADLWPRVVSAAVLLPVAGALVWWGDIPFALLLTFVGAVVAWEWGRLVRGAEYDAAFVVQIATVIAAIVLAGVGFAMLALIAVMIGMVLVGFLSFGRHAILSSLGVLFSALPGIALIGLRADEPHGLAAVLFVLGVVVATDTCAYFAGRLIGGGKIWPAVSPTKTWAGLIGGMSGAALVGVVTALLVPGAWALHLALLGAFLAVVAQLGDFAESALKRRFGAKDSSGLIPGHGGFMDRVDGLVPASIVASLIASLIDPLQPALALLIW